MKREERYPETGTFIYFNANPHNRKGGDCVIRAISTALGQPWETTVRELTEVGIKYGFILDDPKCFERYLANKGWHKHPQPKYVDGTKMTGEAFCKNVSFYNKEGEAGNIIANIGTHHIVAIKPTFHGDGAENSRYKIHDIWNSERRCVGNYWSKGNVGLEG